MANSKIPQHKRLAMGQPAGFRKGGSVPSPQIDKSGKPMSPLTKAKRDNGIPGFCEGGRTRG